SRSRPSAAGARRGTRRAGARPPPAAPRASGAARRPRGGSARSFDDLSLLDDLLGVVGGAGAVARGLRRRRLRARLRVDGLRELVRRVLERLRLGADVADVVAVEGLPELHDPALDRRGLGRVDRLAVLLEALLRLVGEVLRVVLRVGELA